MRISPSTFGSILALVVSATLGGPVVAEAQGDTPSEAMVAAYVRVVAGEFGLPAAEASLLVEEGIRPEELPVALLLARESGLAPSVIVSHRQRGGGLAPWVSVSRQVGLGASVFHAEIPEEELDDRGRAALAAFRSAPRSEWDGVQLDDDHAMTLANVRVLSRGLQVSRAETLAARERAGSWPGSVQFLLGVP